MTKISNIADCIHGTGHVLGWILVNVSLCGIKTNNSSDSNCPKLWGMIRRIPLIISFLIGRYNSSEENIKLLDKFLLTCARSERGVEIIEHSIIHQIHDKFQCVTFVDYVFVKLFGSFGKLHTELIFHCDYRGWIEFLDKRLSISVI